MNTGEADRMGCEVNKIGLGSVLMSGFDISAVEAVGNINRE
jgi:hypothetical protein